MSTLSTTSRGHDPAPTHADPVTLPPRLIEQIERAWSGDGSSQALNVDPADVRRGLGQLVLTLVKLIHELLERQAIRRMEAGTLTDAQAERVGATLMLQAEEIRKLCATFGVEESDLNLDLGPIGRIV